MYFKQAAVSFSPYKDRFSSRIKVAIFLLLSNPSYFKKLGVIVDTYVLFKGK